MLAIAAHFMRGLYAAASGDPSVPEYPPHPLRFYAALVDAAYSCGHEDLLPVLRRIERMPAPVVYAGDRLDTTEDETTLYVPVEASLDDSEGRDSVFVPHRQGMPNPVTRMSPPRVVMVWRVERDAELDAALDVVLPDVVHVGTSESLVEMRRVPLDEHGRMVKGVDDLPLRYVPSLDGDVMLRVPSEGTMWEMDEAFARHEHMNRWTRQMERYESRRSGESGMPSPWMIRHRFRVLGDRIDARRSLPLAEAVRRRLLGMAGDQAPSVLSGHGHDGPHHVAIFPMPFAAPRHGDQTLKGVAIAIPRTCGLDERQEIDALVKRADGDSLRLGDDLVKLRLVLGREHVGRTLSSRAWDRPAKTWASVSPVVLDDWPKGRGNVPTAGASLLRSCERLGLPAPTSISFYPQPMEGVRAPSCRNFHGVFDRCRRGNLPNIMGHVSITWREPVRGPVLLGRLRHFGIGLLMPMGEERT